MHAFLLFYMILICTHTRGTKEDKVKIELEIRIKVDVKKNK